MQLSYQHVNKRSAISPTDNARRQQSRSAQHADAGPRPAASAESAAGRISPEGGGARSFKESGEPAGGVQPIKTHHLQSAKLHTETRGHKQRVRYMHGTAQASRPSHSHTHTFTHAHTHTHTHTHTYTHTRTHTHTHIHTHARHTHTHTHTTHTQPTH